MFSWFSEVFDVTLLATIGLVFFATLMGAYVRAQRRDPCLKSFIDYVITVECAENKVIWGRLELASTGLELRYTDSVSDDNHVESSYVLYTQEFGSIHAVYRYIDELDAKTRVRRRKDLDRSLHPRLLRRAARHIRNFISLASESLSEVIGLIIGGLRKPAGRYITEQSEVRLRELGTTFIGSVGSGYDPLLERFIGQKMVFEIMEDEEVHEHVGIFKQYSPDFFEILDVQMPQKQMLSVEREKAVVTEQIKVSYNNGRVMVDNRSVQMVLLKSITYGDREEPVNAMIDSDEHIHLDVASEYESAVLTFRILREVDMIVPRTRCIVRHRADHYRPEVMPSIIFDLGVKLRGATKIDAQEQRLRKQLEKDPLAIFAMANLGALLAQKQQFDEAEPLLRKAWESRNSLPDNGRRTRQLLQEIQRKRMATPQSRDALRVASAKQLPAASETATLH
jgi:tetratricopeptide (TPR) repeat protein